MRNKYGKLLLFILLVLFIAGSQSNYSAYLINNLYSAKFDYLNFLSSEINEDELFFIISNVFNSNYFTHKRSKNRHGFKRETEFEFRVFNIDYKTLYFKEKDGFVSTYTIEVPINDSTRKRVNRAITSNGVSTEAYINISYNKLKEIGMIEFIKKGMDDLVANAASLRYGRNFIYELNGNILLTHFPQYIIKGGYVYIRLKGIVTFY